LPDTINNLFASTSLRIFSERIGINKINIFDDKAEITLSKNNNIETTKIINLIQNRPQTYQLKNQNTLIFNTKMEGDHTRIEKVRTLAESLN
jgi:transcription-repair coupling factor (superfamily II helicase)